MRHRLFAGAAALLLAAAPLIALSLTPAPAAAQQPTRPRPDTTARDTTRAPRDTTGPRRATRDTAAEDTLGPRLRIRPRTAFFRSLVLPGWGEASAGNYVRGAVFFALAATSDAMLGVTLKRLSTAESAWKSSIADTVALVLKDSTLMAGPDSILRTNPAFWHAQHDTTISGFSLVKSRRRQREDRIFQALFVTLIGGVDAFINAQLSDFPAGVGVEPKEGGGYRIRVDLALPARRPPR